MSVQKIFNCFIQTGGMSDDVSILLKALRTDGYHLFFVQFWHYDSVRELKKQISEKFPDRKTASLDFYDADFETTRSFLLKHTEGLVYLENFQELLKEENHDLRVYLNQRRDAMAENPVAYIILVSGEENMRKMAKGLPDQWSFRQLVVELPMQLHPERHDKGVAITETGTEPIEKFSSDNAKYLENRWKQLIKSGKDQILSKNYLNDLISEWRKEPNPRRRINKLEQLVLKFDNNSFPLQQSEVLNALGQAYHDNGEFDRAIGFYLKALEINKQVLEGENEGVAINLNNIGESYREKGDFEQALEHYQMALEIDQKVHTEEHPVIATILNNIGSVYDSKGEFHNALEHFQKALEIDRKVFGQNHYKVATRLNNIGSVYEDMGEYDKAIDQYEQALSIDKEAFGDEHPNISIRLNNFGSAYSSRGDYKKAINYYEQSLAIDRKIFGENHPRIAVRLNNIGAAYYGMGDYESSISSYEKALKILYKVFPSGHPNIDTTVSSLKFVKDALASSKNG